MELSQQNHCLNCDEVLTTPFCGACGQKKAERISLKEFFKIAQRGIVEFKSPLLVTLWGLTIHPGKVYREYLDGRRATYFNPIRYSFWLITLCVLTSTFFEVPLFDVARHIPESNEKMGTRANELLELLLNSGIIYIYFVMALFQALTVRVFFWKSKFKITELYIVCLLNASHFSLISTLCIILNLYGSMESFYYINLGGLIYACWAIAELYQPRNIINYMLSVLANFISFTIFMFIFGFLLAVYSNFDVNTKQLNQNIEQDKQLVKPK